ncbi:MAG: D-alanyl-D-alanine carboxypeptidase, partial [Lachnospiraceae bacterium]|nr:D-alanyl-D-alanine carboxypeptidase [Lachnospiraceae bacterium]
MKKFFSMVLAVIFCLITLHIPAEAAMELTAPSAILIEASTGQVIYEKNATEQRSPASITKIMTLLLTFEALEDGKISLKDSVLTSEHAASMGGSQVFLEEGETQDMETMIKCIVVASANDASVAVAEYIAGSEAAFVDLMNKKAVELGMVDTHFEDCCGLSDSDLHYTSAKDVAIMSRELITNYPQIYDYTGIWMEDITHVTQRGSSTFTLSSTNKLLKQYPYTTGLKTGSTSKAKFCVSATAQKDNIDLIAVVMGCENGKERFKEAAALLNYGFSVSTLYRDENDFELEDMPVKGALEQNVGIAFKEPFVYLDTENRDLSAVQKVLELPELVEAPVKEGDVAGYAVYSLNGMELGKTEIIYTETMEKATFKDYFRKAF